MRATKLYNQGYRYYETLKEEHPDAVLLLHNGCFYDTFGKDAETVSNIAGMKIGINRNTPGKKCVPYQTFHTGDFPAILKMLREDGYRVVVSETDPEPHIDIHNPINPQTSSWPRCI